MHYTQLLTDIIAGLTNGMLAGRRYRGNIRDWLAFSDGEKVTLSDAEFASLLRLIIAAREDLLDAVSQVVTATGEKHTSVFAALPHDFPGKTAHGALWGVKVTRPSQSFALAILPDGTMVTADITN